MSARRHGRVLLISYHFPPSSAVGAQRPGRLARLLPQYGYDVDVVCAEAEGAIAPPDPTQLVYVPEESSIHRVPTPFILGRNPSVLPDTEGLAARVWWKTRAYLEEVVFTKDWAWAWGRAGVRALGRQLVANAYDIVVLNGPPRTALAPWAAWAREHGIPIVVDLEDLWAGRSESSPIWWPISPKARRYRWYIQMRDAVLQSAEHIVANTPEMAELMRSRVPGVPPSRISDVTNAFDSWDGDAELNVAPPSVPRLVHTGALAYGRLGQAQALIRAVGLLRASGRADVELVFAGDGGEALRATGKAAGVSDRLVVHDWLDRPDAVELQRGASSLVLLQPEGFDVADVAVPAKLYEYMARRRPLLAMVWPGPAARIINEFGLGEVVSSLDPAEIADAVLRILEHVKRDPILPPPPTQFSGKSTVAEFARTLDSVLERREAVVATSP